MKLPSSLSVLVLTCLALGQALAADLPKWVFKIDQLEEAMAMAKKDHKGLAFVYTEPGST